MNISTTPGTVGRVRTPKAAIIRRLAVICALAVSVFAVSASAASAGSDESITTKHGSAAFIDRGGTGTGLRARSLTDADVPANECRVASCSCELEHRVGEGRRLLLGEVVSGVRDLAVGARTGEVRG